MGQRDREHLIITGRCAPQAYASPRRPPPSNPVPPENRSAHGNALRGALVDVEREARAKQADTSARIPGALLGAYVEFESFPGVELALASMESRRGALRPELRAVRAKRVNGQVLQMATVFVPDGAMSHFLQRLDDYLAQADSDKPAHRNLIDRIRGVRLASVEALWTDPPAWFPRRGEFVWWELWLRRRGGELDRLRAHASEAGFEVRQLALGIGNRLVVLVEASAEQLGAALVVLDDIAELRRPGYPAEFLGGLGPHEQRDYVLELAQRVQPASGGAPVVCVVDTGVHRSHPLLEASLDAADCHSVDPDWTPVTGDRDGHGTQMAGLALYGDLGEAISSAGPIVLRHRLESLKLLRRRGADDNKPDLYGMVTAGGIAAVETGAPRTPRVYSMAVTVSLPEPEDPDLPAEDRELWRGKPSSWSAALDALIAGQIIDQSPERLELLEPADPDARRLFIVSAGNVRGEYQHDHLTRSDLSPVEDPAQSWNALTVGAFTNRDSFQHPPEGYQDWTPLAERGELSPCSRTSVNFADRWPIKPDVALEGGNVAESPCGTDRHTVGELELLTTAAPALQDTPSSRRQLTTVGATSAATAQAAHLAAQVLAAYPRLWPETVRALIVHSAEWTPAMLKRFHSLGKRAKRPLLRRYGVGVPDLGRAIRSASDALTLVIEETLTPYRARRYADVHFHHLPWPTDALLDLGDAEVKLKITLSYYVEPNPASRGWEGRYSYPSHSFRFDVRHETESDENFVKRVNGKAREDGEKPDSVNDLNWFIGRTGRTRGSVHSDIWTGTAAALAQRGTIAVYPVGGWWMNDAKARQARYALIVSIETPGVDTDIYTPVAHQLQIPITT